MNLELLRSSILAAARFHFSRSGGPGGQNVNKVNSRVEVRVTLKDLDGLTAAERQHLLIVLSNRITGTNEPQLVLFSSEERSQLENKLRALQRLESLIITAARVPKKRKKTKPSRTERENRLKKKHHVSQKKSRRRLSNFDHE